MAWKQWMISRSRRKLPASLINALFATIVGPLLMNALHHPLHKLGVLRG